MSIWNPLSQASRPGLPACVRRNGARAQTVRAWLPARLFVVLVALLLHASACTLDTAGLGSNFDGDPMLQGDVPEDADSGADGSDAWTMDGSDDAARDALAETPADADWLYRDVRKDGQDDPTGWPDMDADVDAERRDAHPNK